MHCALTAFLLYSYCAHTMSTAYPPRRFHVSTKAKMRSYHVIRQYYVCRSVFNMSVVCLFQVIIESMSRPAIQYKYSSEFLTFTLAFHEHMDSERSSVMCFVSRQPNAAYIAGCPFVVEESKTEKE